MKALLMREYKKLDFCDVPDPVIRDPHDVLIRVKAAAICGSDVHGFDGSTGRRIPPIVMGHEAAGVIVETGAEATYKKGGRVTFDSTVWCGKCPHCLSGRVNLCDNRKVLGVSCAEYRLDGAFAEYVIVPERILFPLPEGLGWEEAACTEPAGVAAHAVRISPGDLDTDSAVVGSGLIGLLVIQILKASAAGKVIALDTDPSRREAALSFGADAALDPFDPELTKKLGELSPAGIERVFEAVGAAAPIATAISIVKKGGQVTLIGNVSPKVEIPLQAVVSRQIRLQGSCAISGEYPAALDLMARGKLDVKRLISAIAPLSEGRKWFDKLYNREDNLLKVVLKP